MRNYPVSNGPRGKGNVTPAGKDEPSAAQVLAEIAEYKRTAVEAARKDLIAVPVLAVAFDHDRSHLSKVIRRLGIETKRLPENSTITSFISTADAKRVADYLATRA